MDLNDLMKLFAKIFGAVYLILGGLLLSNSLSPTGLAIVEDVSVKTISFAGVSLIFNGFLLLSLSRIKKGQAAMEFLMTYGWAILAAIIVLGTLAYFGLFSQTRSSTNHLLLSPPFYVNAFSVTESEVSVEIRNSAGYSAVIDANDFVVVGKGSNEGITCTNSGVINILDSESAVINLDCSSSITSENFNGDVSVDYHRSGINIKQTSSGIIIANVQTGGNQGAQGGLDTNPPVVTFESIAGDLEPFGVNDNKPLVVVSTDENADCRISLDDEDYDSMVDDVDCTGDGSLSHNCQFVTSINDNLAQNIYVSCRDTAQNKNSAGDNVPAVVRIDTVIPLQSNHNPSSSSIVEEAFTLTFDLDEDGDCLVFKDSDKGYDGAVPDVDCLGDGTTAISCDFQGISADFTAYVSCRDSVGNLDTDGTNTRLDYIYKP